MRIVWLNHRISWITTDPSWSTETSIFLNDWYKKKWNPFWTHGWIWNSFLQFLKLLEVLWFFIYISLWLLLLLKYWDTYVFSFWLRPNIFWFTMWSFTPAHYAIRWHWTFFLPKPKVVIYTSRHHHLSSMKLSFNLSHPIYQVIQWC